MPLFARLAFAALDFAARKGLAESVSADAPVTSAKHRAIRTGIRGRKRMPIGICDATATFSSRNYTSSGLKGGELTSLDTMAALSHSSR